MSGPEITAEDEAAGERLASQPWTFVKGVVALEHLPAADRPEIAVAGRSNVGKSSLISALARRKGLARSSNTPGRTQELNFFRPADAHFYLVDMPGYGFAKAPKAKVEAWVELVKAYLRGRPTLARVFVLIDSRHGLKAPDREVLALLDDAAVSYQVVLTKSDKISAPQLESLRKATETALESHPAAIPGVLATSAETDAGIAELRAVMARIAADYQRGSR